MTMNPNGSLLAGTAVGDITPPLEVGLLMSSVKEQWAPFESVRLPLKARVLALEWEGERAAIVSLDLLGLCDASVGGWERFKASLAGSISADRIILTCTHSHTAPESVAITDLYTTAAYEKWLTAVKTRIAAAVNQAEKNKRPCTVLVGTGELAGYSLQRRIPTRAGVVMSDSVQPIAPELLERKPVDHRVRTISLRASDGSPVAVLAHAVCHPVHEMCLPQVSSDFPGELCNALESAGEYGMAMFLNGSAGDTNPTTVCGGEDTARQHGGALARVAAAAVRNSHEMDTAPLAFASREIPLPTRPVPGMPPIECVARMKAIRLGALAMVFLPGEPFVETGQAIEEESPFEETVVVGFAESSIGYLLPDRVYAEGGYELGPGKWSYLAEGTEEIIRAAAGEMLKELARTASAIA